MMSSEEARRFAEGWAAAAGRPEWEGSMPRRNRITPWGEIVATPERGTLMGNRGVLHDGQGRITRPWREKRWIACLLRFKGRKRIVMSPGSYTELFFLDEATSLAAGHRPCAECRRDDFTAFRHAWVASGRGAGEVTAPEIDARLHAERLGPGGTKRTFQADLDELPDGVFVRLHGGEDAWLVRGGLLLAWSPGGYRERLPRPRCVQVAVLTPPSTVAAVRGGYAPQVHGSAG
jgi:hypothetical protein